VTKFLAGPEQQLAYNQFLLTCKTPVAVRRGLPLEELNDFLELIHSYVKGVPSGFDEDILGGVLKYCQKTGVLVDADDERILTIH
jgi:hypothetical protein